MPIHLKPPHHNPTGPDGTGWNRLRIDHPGPSDECALKPHTHAALIESFNTTRATYGAFGPCTNAGHCRECPTLAALRNKPLRFDRPDDRIMIRIDPIRPNLLHAMSNPGDDFSHRSMFFTWQQMTRLDGWRVGRAFTDEISQGFWLIRYQEAAA
jgi:hypothetical protein